MLSKIVKSDDTEDMGLQPYRPPSPEEVDGILEERSREAKRLKIIDNSPTDPLKAAKKEANVILAQAQDKLKEAQVEAKAMVSRQERDIRQKLEKEFQVKLENRLKDLKQQYQDTLEALVTLKQNLFKNSEQEMMELVFAVVKKIIGDEIRSSPEIVISLLQKGFEKLKEAKEIVIHLNSMDYDLLMKEKDRLKEVLQTSGTIDFVQDDSIKMGGCLINSENGEISMEPGKMLDIIMKELSDAA